MSAEYFVRRFKQRRQKSAGPAVVLTAIVLLSGVLVVSFVSTESTPDHGLPRPNQPTAPSPTPAGPPPIAHPAPAAPQPATTPQLIDRVEEAVVRVDVAKGDGWGFGSGFLIDRRGYVVTNYHVIEAASMASVVFSDGTRCRSQGILAISPGKDLAILQIDPDDCRRFRPLELSTSHPAKGHPVLAFGSPKGLSGSVTDGIVSAVRSGQEVSAILHNTTGFDVYSKALGYDRDAQWVQTSAPVSHGNSGGPLVSQSGHVVGVNTWSHGDGENLHFAIASVHIRDLLAGSMRLMSFRELPARRRMDSAKVSNKPLNTKPLKGLTSVHVTVENIRPDAERDGLTRRNIQINTELLLRRYGLRVLDQEAAKREPATPMLYINVNTLRGVSGVYAASVEVCLSESATLWRDKQTVVFAKTWHAVGSVHLVPPTQMHRLYQTVDRAVKEFINAHWSQNQE